VNFEDPTQYLKENAGKITRHIGEGKAFKKTGPKSRRSYLHQDFEPVSILQKSAYLTVTEPDLPVNPGPTLFTALTPKE
jgi:hypothetical protein